MFEKVLALNDSNPDVLLKLGIALNKLKRHADARPVLAACAAMLPDSAHVHQSLGLALQELDNLEGAEREFAKALELDPQ